jgi:hypothetical protein
MKESCYLPFFVTTRMTKNIKDSISFKDSVRVLLPTQGFYISPYLATIKNHEEETEEEERIRKRRRKIKNHDLDATDKQLTGFYCADTHFPMHTTFTLTQYFDHLKRKMWAHNLLKTTTFTVYNFDKETTHTYT